MGLTAVPVQGLHPLKDSAFVIFEGESFRETLLTSSAVVKLDSLVLEHFLGASPDVLPLCHNFCRQRTDVSLLQLVFHLPPVAVLPLSDLPPQLLLHSPQLLLV